jgi:tRNA modification GTPase
MLDNDTIAAIATPLGSSGVSIVRISGPDSWEIARKIIRKSNKSLKLPEFTHSVAFHGWIVDNYSASLIDEVMVLPFGAPKSYTTEDVIEIQCHGGFKVTQKILDLCLKNGARPAERGEFTKRAFIAGRIDLVQVESVIDLISAKTNLFSSAAAYNLSGKLSGFINEIRVMLIKLLAHIEASVDFPEEVDEMPFEDFMSSLMHIEKTIIDVLRKASDGNILKNGIKITIVGRPNAGKSTLFNCLLNSDRAIVTEIPGTTRDVLMESFEIDGIPVTVTDTAGIRDVDSSNQADLIESIGIDRSKSSIQDCDLVIFVYDARSGIDVEDTLIMNDVINFNKPMIKVANKTDLILDKDFVSGIVHVSAKNNTNIDLLRQKIKELILGPDFNASNDEYYINMRHKECLNKALMHVELSVNALNSEDPHDLISIDVKSALLSLNEIVGEVVTEEILDSIFSQFCVGK